MEPGSCFARSFMYYYDSEEKVCRLFLYKGCQGNGNRFETKEDCESMCRGQFSSFRFSSLSHYQLFYDLHC
ncbi:boophilin-H2 [Silurus asotus]|uniref:Boophilin-H2 n=1 Tax=Silurus asotus TaxID=30991 RepID=A0AAD5FQH6_SILAS|nr:boophilin-H2 [Silurus asotus]